MGTEREPDTILRDIAAIEGMERGKISEIRAGNGRVYHSLQFWSDGRNRCEYVPAGQLDAVVDAVGNYARFKSLVDEYAGAVEGRTRRLRREERAAEKKRASAKTSPRPRPKR